MRLLGKVKKMDVDADGKASGAFLPARLEIELSKPIKRGVLLRMSMDGAPKWDDAQYEKLHFLCFSCGILGHGGLECDKLAVRNAQGRLSYECDPPLRAPDDRRKKVQSFAEAAAESFGSGSSSSERPTRPRSSMSGGRDGGDGIAGERRPTAVAGGGAMDAEEVTLPVKKGSLAAKKKSK
jgi:hypothetical protein